ncbi:uncharacterized protein RAG0_01095 [Rhynchosporium agropyri]|uniref:Uncharacterized protein n=1 Tax=Rhynchosporium agropyri TaxID=914238 RepID=A0A1E1JW22_9HELO|nr:uncharacterized protein RAG0_01095 [Rhynchosporium agropyri]
MVSSSATSTIISFAAITASAPRIFNVINPIFAQPSGKNVTGPLGASIVGVDSTATTYQIGCNGNINHTKPCGWDTPPFWYFTQGPTEEHFTISDREKSGEGITIQGDYTFSSTLAPTITGAFQLTQVVVSNYDITTTTDLSTLPSYSEETVDVSATWYAIPVTAGWEKLSRNVTASVIATVMSGARITATGTSIRGSGKATGSGGVPTSTGSVAGGERVVGRVGLLVGVLGGVGVLAGLVL